MITIVAPVIILFTLIILVSFGSSNAMYIIAGGCIAAAIITSFFYFVQTSLASVIFNKYLLYFVLVLIILVAASIVFTIFSGTLRKYQGWTGFLANFVFYIPCLIRDAIHSAIQEYNSFSKTLMVLFVLEVMLLLMYFFLIPVVYDRMVPEHVVLLEDPILLNTYVPIENKIKNQNFSISMWVYLNPDNNEQNPAMFSYMTPQGTRWIQLGHDNETNEFTMTVENDQYSIALPLQKWHNFVFTFNEFPKYAKAIKDDTKSAVSYVLDIFINGNLERSHTFSKKPEFTPADRMYIGPYSKTTNASGINVDSQIDGKYGAICNIVYYKTPISSLSLIYNYNLYSIRNPPL
jgi:hypothetical protein